MFNRKNTIFQEASYISSGLGVFEKKKDVCIPKFCPPMNFQIKKIWTVTWPKKCCVSKLQYVLNLRVVKIDIHNSKTILRICYGLSANLTPMIFFNHHKHAFFYIFMMIAMMIIVDDDRISKKPSIVFIAPK